MPSNRSSTYTVRLQVDGAGRATADLTGVGQAGDRAFVRIERSASGARQQMQRLLHMGGQVRAGMAALAGGVAIAGIAGLTTAALESVSALADQADAIGLNVERLQEYRIAASAVGVEQDKTDQNLQRFIRRWGQAADGTGTLATTLRRLGIAVRDSDGHWGIENQLHWVLDVVFRDDQSRLRKGHGAKNMAVVRHFALNLVRAISNKTPIKRRRKIAGWNVEYRATILGVSPR